MLRVLRVLLYLTYPFLGLSLLLLVGDAFGGAFVVKFVVRNGTDQVVFVTPVGTVGRPGFKAVLPIVVGHFPYWRASQSSRLRLDPGGAITIHYDFDDINFSEIVVEDEHGRSSLLVVDSEPTANQYHPPRQKEFVIDDSQTLLPVPAEIHDAIVASGRRAHANRVLLGLLALPWVALIVIRSCMSRIERRDAATSPDKIANGMSG